MPVYEYFCRTCDGKFEVRSSIATMTPTVACTEGHEAHKVLSVFATVTAGRSEFAPAAEACCGPMGCGSEACCIDEP